MRSALLLLAIIGLAACAGPSASGGTACPACPPQKACPPHKACPPCPADPAPPGLKPGPAQPETKVTPLSANCQAPLELHQAVERLLSTAAAHSTRSSACVDGPGERVTVEDVRTCKGSHRQGKLVIDCSYKVVRRSEGDTRMMTPAQADEFVRPRVTLHRASLTFTVAGKEAAIDLPAAVPGMPGMTPLDREHKGGCYGQSGPFEPGKIRLER